MLILINNLEKILSEHKDANSRGHITFWLIASKVEIIDLSSSFDTFCLAKYSGQVMVRYDFGVYAEQRRSEITHHDYPLPTSFPENTVSFSYIF